MNIAYLVILILANAFILVYYFAIIHPRLGWACPLSIVLPTYALHYPIRAITVWYTGNPYDLSMGEVCEGLSYGTCFIFICTIIFGNLSRSANRQEWSQIHTEEGNRPSYFFHLLCLMYLIGFAYRTLGGHLFTLGSDNLDSIVILSRYFSSIKWFLLAYILICARRGWTALMIAEIVAIVGTILLQAIFSSAKGELVYLVILGLLKESLTRKITPIKYTILGSAICILFAFYSYTIRYYGTVRGPSSLMLLRDNLRIALDRASDSATMERNVISVFDRFSYLDGLILCQRKDTFLQGNPYMLGSIAEAQNILFLLTGSTSKRLKFNKFVTADVWGLSESLDSMTPIGRIGESFYVLNWLGLIYAFVCSFAWWWLFNRLFKKGRNYTIKAFYIAVFYEWIVSDDIFFPPLMTLGLISMCAFVEHVISAHPLTRNIHETETVVARELR